MLRLLQADEAKVARCHRALFCGPACQKKIWPVHKTQCDPKIDYWRAAPLIEEEAAGLLLIADENRGYGSYPHTPKRFSLVEALKEFGKQFDLKDPENVSVHVKAASRPAPLDLQQTRLALFFRFFLRPTGECRKNMHHMIAQAKFPLIVNTPSGEPALRLRAGQEPLAVARGFADSMLVYAYACWEMNAANQYFRVLEAMQWQAGMSGMLKTLQEWWWDLPGRHKAVLDSSVIGWHRGVYGLVDENSPTTDKFYLTDRL
ncbi:hypothetical protein JCM10213_003770 [Rhodosporidiobolus nylandii]